MRVLWITNGPIMVHKRQIGVGFNQGGGWLDAAFDGIKNHPEVKLGLATVYKCNSLLKHTVDGVDMYAVPRGTKRMYDYSKGENIDYWKVIRDDFRPDIIHIWGTEMSHSLCALNAIPNVPAVVYIQGLMSQIFKHSESGIDYLTKLRYSSIRDIITNRGINPINLLEKKRANIEEQIIRQTGNVIVESEWSALNCQVINPNCRLFYSMLPIKTLFANKTWTKENMMPHTVFTVAGGYPIKGHHILYQALGIVKKRFPDVKLYIPGYNPVRDDNGMKRIFPTTYTKYVRSIIKQHGLEQNIVYLGKINSEDMANYMSRCNIFVMPSAIENHSSTLIEAMLTGAPCISSYVGGVSNYMRHGVNGFMYRYEEYETLAGLIMKLFDAPELAGKIGSAAKNDSVRERLSIDVASDFVSIYNNLVK